MPWNTCGHACCWTSSILRMQHVKRHVAFLDWLLKLRFAARQGRGEARNRSTLHRTPLAGRRLNNTSRATSFTARCKMITKPPIERACQEGRCVRRTCRFPWSSCCYVVFDVCARHTQQLSGQQTIAASQRWTTGSVQSRAKRLALLGPRLRSKHSGSNLSPRLGA